MAIKQSLLIVASGKSSRFGGYPKALAPIGHGTNVENTIRQAQSYFKKIYLAVNKETYSQFEQISKQCEVFDIQTGNGDAHSLLKCLKHIREAEPACKRITVCWGDAFFLNSTPFWQLGEAEKNLPDGVPVLAACAVDQLPYAWFETNGPNIRRVHFSSVDGPTDFGIHDQSLFLFSVDKAISYLEKYKKYLNIADEYDPNSREMKLLYSFEYLYDCGEFMPARYMSIDSGNVLSFNTKEELENIRKKMIQSRLEDQKNLC